MDGDGEWDEGGDGVGGYNDKDNESNREQRENKRHLYVELKSFDWNKSQNA